MTRPVLRFDDVLGQPTRIGTWEELAVGTYQVIGEALAAHDFERAADLIRVTIEEAAELRDVYSSWPNEIIGWLESEHTEANEIADAKRRVEDLLVHEYGQRLDLAAEWDRYVTFTEAAVAACAGQDGVAAAERTEQARRVWQHVHDYCVDEVYGLLDCVVRIRGEDTLVEVWNHLMRDWYDDHTRRLDVRNQPWSESARQLMTAIVHGFHGHLSGTDRLGGMTFTEEADRWGFQFDPCGSGGRVIRDDTTDGKPRPGEPFHFAATTRAHDWSWSQAGVQAYCVHCCLLNMVVPIDRLGYPTRVIEPPTWPQGRNQSRCTWWVYKDPSLVPDEVFHRVGRQRPTAQTEEGTT